MYSAKIICDSVSETGKRLTTFEITFPRIVLAEFNTHRMLSRNSASSRAIPFAKQLERIRENPFVPEQFPLNTKGMQPAEYITKENTPKLYDFFAEDWLEIRDIIIDRAEDFRTLMKLCGERVGDRIYDIEDDYQMERFLETKQFSSKEIHKQLINRLLEPFMWHTVIVTATEWDNFFKLRTNPQAQYEIKRIADLMYEIYHAYENSNEAEVILEIIKPKELKVGEWHLPFVNFDSESEDWKQIDEYIRSNVINKEARLKNYSLRFIETAKKISVARCARVSYLTHDGKRDIEKDLELFERLRTSGHWSPFEHVATPFYDIGAISVDTLIHEDGTPGWDENKTWVDYRSGNFIGWKQFRKEFQDENCTYFRKE